MRRKSIALFCFGFLFILTNYSFAQQPKEITCSGKITDAQGLPIAGANVVAFEMLSRDKSGNIFLLQVGNAITTKADGRFVFKTESRSVIRRIFITPGNCIDGYIVAEKDGFALGWAGWNMRRDMESDIEISQPRRLEGMVVNEAGEPVGSAEVRAILYRNMETTGAVQNREWLPGITPLESLGTKTDSRGRFQFANLPEDSSVDLLVRADGKTTISTYQTELGPAFKAGQTNTRIVLPAECRIEGRIVDKSTGKGISGVEVITTPYTAKVGLIAVPRFSAAFYEPLVCVSKEDGTFSIGKLSEGQYCLQGNFPFQKNIFVGSGKNTSEVIIQCHNVVRGHVTGPDGKPVANADVQIRQYRDLKAASSWRIRAGNVKTDRSGRYIHTDIGGPYTVGVVYREIIPAEEGYRFQYIRRNEAYNGSQKVDFQFNSFPKGTASITGQVTDQHGKAFEEFTVNIQTKVDWDNYSDDYLFNHGCQKPFTTTDGRFEIKDFPAGIYHISIYNPYDRGRYIFPRMDDLVLEKNKIATVTYTVTEKSVYYGRVLFEDDSSVYVDSPPWQGAKTYVRVPSRFGGSSTPIDKEGYFEAFLTDEELDRVKSEGFEMKIYYPSFTEERVSYPLEDFPIELLSKDKTQAGVVKVLKPTYTPSINLANAPSLKYKPLPKFNGIKIDFNTDKIKNKEIVVCFFDMEQRPSRNCIIQLSKRAHELAAKEIAVVAVQASKIDKSVLEDWVKEYKIPFAVGMIEIEEEKARFAWGIRSLPWLILTDKKQAVRAEGFSITELDQKIGELENVE